MRKDKAIRFLLTFMLAIALIGSANSLVCVTVGNDQTWNDAQLKIGEKAYFTLVVYNNSADGRFCDTAKYGVFLTVEGDIELTDILDYEIDITEFTLSNQEYKRVLITITPKVEGYYELRVTAAMMPEESGGTTIKYGSSARIKAHFSETGEEKFSEVPFWTVRKDCPNGVVVKEGEECPREVCDDGSFAYGDDYCPEDKPAIGVFSFGQFSIGGMDEGTSLGIVGILAVLGVCSSIIYFTYVRKPKIQQDELYEAQRYY